MKKLRMISLLLVLTSLASHGFAQDEKKALGFVFVAPGAIHGNVGTLGSIHYGVGGEGFLHKGFSLGGDVGYVAPFRAQNDGFGLINLNPAYHFGWSKKKVSPFVTGGYSMAIRSGVAHGFNVGAGFDLWFKEHHGLRLEFRDQIFPGGGTDHVLGFRIGYTFR